jgi:hypothetical protein
MCAGVYHFTSSISSLSSFSMMGGCDIPSGDVVNADEKAQLILSSTNFDMQVQNAVKYVSPSFDDSGKKVFPCSKFR